jgi:hypothetical protein
LSRGRRRCWSRRCWRPFTTPWKWSARRALALYGATSGIAAVVGQLVGGLLVSADVAGTSWRPIFLVNVPLGVIVLLAASRIVPRIRFPHPVGADLPGAVLFAATLTAMLIPLTEGRSLGWPWWTWLLIALAVLLGAATYLVEKRAEARGQLPPLLRLPSMSRGLVMVLAFSAGFGAFMFVFALTIQNGLPVPDPAPACRVDEPVQARCAVWRVPCCRGGRGTRAHEASRQSCISRQAGRPAAGSQPVIVVPWPGCERMSSVPPSAASRSDMPCRPEPVLVLAAAKPAPSSVTANRRLPSEPDTRTLACAAVACLAMFCRASSAQK